MSAKIEYRELAPRRREGDGLASENRQKTLANFALVSNVGSAARSAWQATFFLQKNRLITNNYLLILRFFFRHSAASGGGAARAPIPQRKTPQKRFAASSAWPLAAPVSARVTG
jgi:hypothetical protein